MKKLKNRREIKEAGLVKGGSSQEYKTGSWKDKIPVVNEEKCINCLMCVNYCPENAINIKKNKGVLKRGDVNLDFCKGCGICKQVCPVNAIEMYDVDEAKKLIKKKKYTLLKNKKK
jgi:pyruvate ferredoxin oxidoreductase delta subunit